jgi:hypothetical protein
MIPRTESMRGLRARLAPPPPKKGSLIRTLAEMDLKKTSQLHVNANWVVKLQVALEGLRL